MTDIKLHVELDEKLQIAHLLLYSKDPPTGTRKFYRLTTNGDILFEEVPWDGEEPTIDKIAFVSIPITFYEILSTHWQNEGRSMERRIWAEELKNQFKPTSPPAMMVATGDDYLKLLLSKQQNTIDKLISLWQLNLNPKARSRRKAPSERAMKKSETSS